MVRFNSSPRRKSMESHPTVAQGSLFAPRLVPVLEKLGLSCWSLDLTSGTITVEPRLAHWFGAQSGASPDQRGWLLAVHEEDRERLRDGLAAAALGGPLEVRYRLAAPRARRIWIEGLGTGEDAAGGTLLFGVVGEAGPEPSDGAATGARSLGPLAPVLYVARYDREQRHHWVNGPYARRFGGHPEEFVGKTLEEVLGADVRAILEPCFARALRGEDTSVELDLPGSVGGLCQSTLALFPECDSTGQVTGLCAVAADMTEIRRSERALYLREREFKTIIENSPDIVSRLDRQARHLYINRAAEEPFGIVPAACIGKTMAELGLPESVAEAYANATAGVFESGLERAFGFVLGESSRPRHYTARAIPEQDPAGNVESVLIITYDVTQRTEAQLERDALLIREQAARMQAEAAARARDEFLAIVSHELRSPLNGIQSWTHVLENAVGDESPAVARALAGIKLGVQQQVGLIDDLLDATLIMTGKLRLAQQQVDIAALVEGAVAAARGPTEERQIALAIRSAPGATVEGDPGRLLQIVRNLLSNAIKFTASQGHIWVDVGESEGDLVISVRDDGRGIAPEFLPYLFDPFRQADGSSTRRAGGIGLGLTLVRRLTELHGGRVSAQSPGDNQGSSFVVRLPLRSGTPEGVRSEQTVRAIGPSSLTSLRGRRIVLVDDQREARDSLTQLLEQAGASVCAFGSGLEVVNHFRTILPRDWPDVLICDIAMPEQDGYVTLQQIRALERSRLKEGRRELPAVALTAFSQREDKIRALANGFQVHLAKPVDPAELINVIHALAPQSVAKRASASRISS